jgi:FtsP/CotA-like multicopper oxidase with cupredoxin domain
MIMKIRDSIIRSSWVLTVAIVAALVMLSSGSAQARAWIDGITQPSGGYSFTARAGEVSTPDGGAIHFWGYEDTTGAANPYGLPQYPGPTLIVTQGDTVTVTLTNNLPIANGGTLPVQPVSIVFPGHQVTATGGTCPTGDCLLTRESTTATDTLTYTFTATEPGTYMYHSGTQMELQVEMGLVGALIVRPSSGNSYAYNNPDTYFDHEYLFLTTQMDPMIHQLVEQQRFSEIDMTKYWPVYWFFNGRAGPDDLAESFVAWLPHQPYNCTPRMTPGQQILMRVIGGDQGQHPFHYHGNNADIIARDGRLLQHPRSQFTTLTVPGETVDQLFTWTGANMGWDIYGDPTDPNYTHVCIDSDGDGFGDASAGSTYDYEYCADHGLTIPVILPEQQNLTFGGWWSGSPFMGGGGNLPPGEGGLNPFGGYFFMWHSHAEKELTNFDIFPGGMLSMMVVEPPGTPIP